MQRQNPSMPVKAWWWCLATVGFAACGVSLGEYPAMTSASLLLVTIAPVPAAVMLGLWPAAHAAMPATLVFAEGRAAQR